MILSAAAWRYDMRESTEWPIKKGLHEPLDVSERRSKTIQAGAGPARRLDLQGGK